MNVGAVDMTEHQSVGAPYGIQGFPTIKVFGANKQRPLDYQGLLSSCHFVLSLLLSYSFCSAGPYTVVVSSRLSAKGAPLCYTEISGQKCFFHILNAH